VQQHSPAVDRSTGSPNPVTGRWLTTTRQFLQTVIGFGGLEGAATTLCLSGASLVRDQAESFTFSSVDSCCLVVRFFFYGGGGVLCAKPDGQSRWGLAEEDDSTHRTVQLPTRRVTRPLRTAVGKRPWRSTAGGSRCVACKRARILLAFGAIAVVLDRWARGWGASLPRLSASSFIRRRVRWR